MFALRNRSRTGSESSASYSKVSTEEEQEDILELEPYKPKYSSKPKSNFCTKVCFIFSLFAVIFLSIIALLLSQDSLYLKVSAENQDRKPKLVQGVLGAIFMYLACMALTGYLWYKSCAMDSIDIKPRMPGMAD